MGLRFPAWSVRGGNTQAGETIYLSLFIQARGGLKRELAQHLRTRSANRRPQGKRPPSGKGQIVDPVMISERPAEVEDRAVPGHWEGDLWMEGD